VDTYPPSEKNLEREDFERLLSWLHADRELAGEKYEAIRRGLIKVFIWNRCFEAEELADVTINRVMRKLPEIAQTYVGDPSLYFYGVAKKLILEHHRRSPVWQSLPEELRSNQEPIEVNDKELVHDCLDRCLSELRPQNRDLILQYYQRSRQKRTGARKELANQLGISVNALRVRMYSIRATLGACIEKCIKSKTSARR
jgi:RNA polymerase sigma factor (sigma-70 family)